MYPVTGLTACKSELRDIVHMEVRQSTWQNTKTAVKQTRNGSAYYGLCILACYSWHVARALTSEKQSSAFCLSKDSQC